MIEKNYSKRELDTAFKEIRDHLTSQDGVLQTISAKLDYTNGKVKFHDFIINTFKWVVGTGIALALVYLTYLTYIHK